MPSILKATVVACVWLAILPAAFVQAHDYKLGSLEIGHPWTRAMPPTARSGGGFLTITNSGTTPDRLIAARSNASAKVEIHEIKMDGSVMRMRELAGGLEIPPGTAVVLKPGSYHLMFMEVGAPFTKSARVPVTLVFERAGRIDVEMKVEAMGATGSDHKTH